MLHVVLHEPQIPQNTGNVGRMCAFTGCRLHLIHPLGFVINDRNLRRAGMDYWKSLDVYEHADWAQFRLSPHAPRRLWLFTTHGERSFWDAPFADDDGLLFGNEGEGSPAWLHEEIGRAHRLVIPQVQGAAHRSLNLSTAAGIATYEALRQTGLLGRGK
jgi:tRNA (cytidine/uridine-2'-O-)-methyltransferase